MEDSHDIETITAHVRAFLDSEYSKGYVPSVTSLRKADESAVSVYMLAQKAGRTLAEYVEDDPATALHQAEACLAYWLNAQTSAVFGALDVSRETSRLIQNGVAQAQKELDKVEELYSSFMPGQKRRDVLVDALYKRAVRKGDIAAAKYLIDRVDGRAGESAPVASTYDQGYNVYQIVRQLFDKQREVLNSGSGTKLIMCGRRSGKTRLLVSECLIAALEKPNTTCIYIGETAKMTEQLFDTAFNEIVDAVKLKDGSGNRLDWRRLENRSHIMVRGLTNTRDPDVIRGNKAKIIVVDEFFHLKDELLEYLVREVLRPMQMDYANDYKFICAGSPPSIKGTYGDYCWDNWNVPRFGWTFMENPYPVDPEEKKRYVEQELAEMGLTWESSFAQREYLNRRVYDEDLLLYPEYHTYNPNEGMPRYHIDQILFGIDYGIGDSDCLVGIAWDNENRRGYVYHEDKFNRLDVQDRKVSQFEYLKERVTLAWEAALDFFPDLSPKEANKRILWDADDNQQHMTDDFNANIRIERHPELRLNIQNAHKTDKTMMFDKLRDLFRTGALLVPVDGPSRKELDQTVQRRGPGGQVYPEVDNKVFHPDILPAIRYAMWNILGQESYKSKGAWNWDRTEEQGV